MFVWGVKYIQFYSHSTYGIFSECPERNRAPSLIVLVTLSLDSPPIETLQMVEIQVQSF